MVRRNLSVAGALAVALLLPAAAAEPPHYTFSPRPPGQIVQSALFYPAGEGMQSQWRAVASRVHLGGSAYQWYLSVYAINFDTATYKLQYRSPGNGPLLSRVTRAQGGLWLPLQSLHIVGAGELVRAGVQNLVVQSHESSADCGGASVTVFTYDWTAQHFRPVAVVTNGCALAASLVHGSTGDAIRLIGPYYSATAPLCCPTKERAVAYLRYAHGKWTESPSYFALKVP
ncbi:MAG: hypothetical protein ACYC8W_07945 [Candidatus Tyrphobacter sp.]